MTDRGITQALLLEICAEIPQNKIEKDVGGKQKKMYPTVPDSLAFLKKCEEDFARG